jgi:hypothetical protein
MIIESLWETLSYAHMHSDSHLMQRSVVSVEAQLLSLPPTFPYLGLELAVIIFLTPFNVRQTHVVVISNYIRGPCLS